MEADQDGPLGDAVAILTDPLGSVLPKVNFTLTFNLVQWLRSSPTPAGRCCYRSVRYWGTTRPVLRSSPTSEDRCCARPDQQPDSGRGCDPHRPRRIGAAWQCKSNMIVAPLLRSLPTPSRGGAAPGAAPASASSSRRCDPHRPSRVGPAPARPASRHRGTCCCEPHRLSRVGAAQAERVGGQVAAVVAILTDPLGSALQPSLSGRRT